MKGTTELEQDVIAALRECGLKATWNGPVIRTGSNSLLSPLADFGAANIYVIDPSLFYFSGDVAIEPENAGQKKAVIVVDQGRNKDKAELIGELLKGHFAGKAEALPVICMTETQFREAGGYRGMFKAINPDIVQEVFRYLMNTPLQSKLVSIKPDTLEAEILVSPEEAYDRCIRQFARCQLGPGGEK